MFSPVLFSIGVVTADDPDIALANLREALAKVTTPTDSGFVIAPEVVAFANRHPDPAKDILVEVQALNEDALAKGIALVTATISEVIGSGFIWEDVTEVALAYHLELRKAEEESDETTGV